MEFKLLIIEDNSDSRNLLHYLLTSQGFQVTTAADGAEGLYMAKVEKPDLIITDLMMPNVDGIELVKRVRAEASIANVPILIYTAYSTETIAPAIEAGANKSFYKPVDLDDMLLYINEILAPDRNKDA